MSPCSSVDLKAYALGEATAEEIRAVKAHAAMCPACGSELERLRATKSALTYLREEELPRRIAFVSDREVVPFWWQVRRMFPHVILPSAVALGTLAFFLLPGFQPQRPPTLVVQVAAPATPASSAATNVDVEKRIQAAVAKAVAESEARQERKTVEMLAAADKKHNVELRSVQVAFEEAWRLKEKQLSTMYVALNRMDDGSSR